MTKRLCAVLLVLSAPLTACSGSAEVSGISDGETKTATGVLLDVDAESIDQVEGFILKVGDETYDVLIADDVEYEFPLGHLQEHLQDALPVTVEMENREGVLYALSVDDA